MLVDNSNDSQKYNVVVDGEIKRFSVTKPVANHYIVSLDENMQSKAVLVPITNDGKEILFG